MSRLTHARRAARNILCLVKVKGYASRPRTESSQDPSVRLHAELSVPLTYLVGELEEPLKGSRLVAARLLSNQPNFVDVLCILPSTYTMFACLNLAPSRPVLQVKQVNLLTLGDSSFLPLVCQLRVALYRTKLAVHPSIDLPC
jgi:hypothetical protein